MLSSSSGFMTVIPEGIDHLAIYKTGDNRQIDAKQLRLTVFRYHIVRIVYQGIFQRLIIPIGVWKHSDCSQMVVKVMLFASQIDQICGER